VSPVTEPPSKPSKPPAEPSAPEEDKYRFSRFNLFAPNPARIERRQKRIEEGIRKARTGDYLIPTWALGLGLLLLIGLLVYLAVSAP
jgi:hypothetical protein